MKIGWFGIMMLAFFMAVIAVFALFFYSLGLGGSIGDIYVEDEIYIGFRYEASEEYVGGVEQKYGLKRVWLKDAPRGIKLGYYRIVGAKTAQEIREELAKEKFVAFADLIMKREDKSD